MNLPNFCFQVTLGCDQGSFLEELGRLEYEQFFSLYSAFFQ